MIKVKSVQKLRVAAVTGVSFVGVPSSVSNNQSISSSTFSSQLQLRQVLGAEGASAMLFVYATMSDGHVMDVTRISGVTVASLASTTISVSGSNS